MARTSLIISITFTGFIILSIAQIALGVSKFGQAVGASVPYEAANANRDGTFAANKHGVNDKGTTEVNAAKGSANAYLVGVGGLDSEKGQAKIDWNTGGNVAGVAGVKRGGNLVVDYKKGQVNEKAKTDANAANGLLDVKEGEHTTVDSKKDGVPADKKSLEQENSYPAKPMTKNTSGNYN